MSIATSIVAAIIGYFVLLVISASLIGIIVDGFVQPDPRQMGIPEDISQPKSIAVTVIFALIALIFLLGLYNFWNFGIALSALMLMISRIPDLVFESKTGQKNNSNLNPKRSINMFCKIVGWSALPLLWYSLFFLPSRITL